MSTSTNQNKPSSNNTWKLAPIELLALLLFSGLTTLFSAYYYTLASESLRDAVVPHTGWIGHFLYIMFFILSAILLLTRKNKLRKNIIVAFVFLMLYGIFNYYIHIDKDNFGNPYLTYGAYRPIWDIALPILWAFLLSTKRVKEYCNVVI